MVLTILVILFLHNLCIVIAILFEFIAIKKIQRIKEPRKWGGVAYIFGEFYLTIIAFEI
jgi:hypothetical protein